MEKRNKTSIQYQFSNVVLFDKIFNNWEEFNSYLTGGPDKMKQYLFDTWNETKENLLDNSDLIITDIDKEVTIKDFDITYNKSKKGSSVFYFILPDLNDDDASSKYIALVLTKEFPMYFTLETSINRFTNEKQFFVGEFKIVDNKKVHLNHGKTDNDRISWFAGFVLNKLSTIEK